MILPAFRLVRNMAFLCRGTEGEKRDHPKAERAWCIHMKTVMSYCYYPEAALTAAELDHLLHRLGLQGIEQLVYQTEPNQQSFAGQTVGVHLKYWPYWMDFLLGRRAYWQEQFPRQKDLDRYYGGHTVDGWENAMRSNIRAALKEQPEYVVWHISNSSNREACSFHFAYTDREVLREAAAVFNDTADAIPPHVTVLFENLWWPGLRLLNPYDTAYFFSLIHRDHVGIMLDTGHLMNTDDTLRGEEDGAALVESVLRRMGSLSQLIRGIHLNCSLSADYRKQCRKKEFLLSDMAELIHHIMNIDQHRPFHTQAAARIIAAVHPDYVVHELTGRDLPDTIKMIETQIKAGTLS